MDPVNPYQVPAAPLSTGASSESLQKVASGQKLIIWAILGYFGLIPLNLAVTGLTALGPDGGPGFFLGLFLSLVLLAVLAGVLVLGCVGLYRLLKGLGRSTPATIVSLLFMLIPLAGLILLLVYNSRATKALRAAGWRVGLLGATPPAGR